jgi:hypothetical protein
MAGNREHRPGEMESDAMNRIAVIILLAALLVACGGADNAANLTDRTATPFAATNLTDGTATSFAAKPSPVGKSLSEALNGKFSTKRYGEMVIQFSNDGTFSEDVLSCSSIAAANGCAPFKGLKGTYKVDGSSVTFTDSGGPCAGIAAAYEAEMGVSLSLSHKGVDRCPYRQLWYDGRWDALPQPN